MNKQTAIDLLGGSPKKAAESMGYTSVQAIYMWPETLGQALTDQVRGALMRIAESKNQPEKAVS